MSARTAGQEWPRTEEAGVPPAPAQSARDATVVRQLLRLPRTLWAIHRIVRQDFAPAVLDRHLQAFWGFYQEPANPRYRARPWQQVRLRAIEPANVIALSVSEMAVMLTIAMEDESPIIEYSHQSGEGFRYLLPTLGRFMGSNKEEAAYAAAHGLPWCEGAWCAEERRHSRALARTIERLIQGPANCDNPNQPMVVTASEADAVRHLVSRQTSEWNASSGYVLMAAHARGELHRLIRNLACDEVKHLAILSAANVYLFGPLPWRRFAAIVKKSLANYRNEQRSRTGGELLGANPVTAVEGICAHLLTECCVRKWLKTVPLRTLMRIFEVQSNLLDPKRHLSEEQRIETDETLTRGEGQRRALARWPARARRKALRARSADEAHDDLIRRVIDRDFDQFRGAEHRGSGAAARVMKRISGYHPMAVRVGVAERLREYQILQAGRGQPDR